MKTSPAPAAIRHTILTVLAEVAPHALPHAQLLRDLNRLLRPAVPAALATTHLRALLDRGLVACLPDELDPDDRDLNRWLITEAGQATLRR